MVEGCLTCQRTRPITGLPSPPPAPVRAAPAVIRAMDDCREIVESVSVESVRAVVELFETMEAVVGAGIVSTDESVRKVARGCALARAFLAFREAVDAIQ